jgi:hypothetical protein
MKNDSAPARKMARPRITNSTPDSQGRSGRQIRVLFSPRIDADEAEMEIARRYQATGRKLLARQAFNDASKR